MRPEHSELLMHKKFGFFSQKLLTAARYREGYQKRSLRDPTEKHHHGDRTWIPIVPGMRNSCDIGDLGDLAKGSGCLSSKNHQVGRRQGWGHETPCAPNAPSRQIEGEIGPFDFSNFLCFFKKNFLCIPIAARCCVGVVYEVSERSSKIWARGGEN